MNVRQHVFHFQKWGLRGRSVCLSLDIIGQQDQTAPHSHPGISPRGQWMSKTCKKPASYYQFPPPLSFSLSPAMSKNTAAEEFAAVNLSRLVGFLHLIAPTPVLCACLTECSSSVLSKITFIHPHSGAHLPALPTHSPPYATEPSVTEAPGRSGSGSLAQASWDTSR